MSSIYPQKTRFQDEYAPLCQGVNDFIRFMAPCLFCGFRKPDRPETGMTPHQCDGRSDDQITNSLIW